MQTSGLKFIHAVDIHLYSALHGLERCEGAHVKGIRSATRRALDNLVRPEIDDAVTFVLLAGDLYDGDWRDYNTGLYFMAHIGRLLEAVIRIFMVAGNHDAARQITKLCIPRKMNTVLDEREQMISQRIT